MLSSFFPWFENLFTRWIFYQSTYLLKSVKIACDGLHIVHLLGELLNTAGRSVVEESTHWLAGILYEEISLLEPADTQYLNGMTRKIARSMVFNNCNEFCQFHASWFGHVFQ